MELTKNAGKSIASAASVAGSAISNTVSGWLARREEARSLAPKVPEVVERRQPDWLSALTRDDQSPEVVEKVAEKLRAILMSDESLCYVAVQNRPIVNWMPDCIALTDKRFILYRPKLLGRVDFEDYVWRELHDATLKDDLVGSTVSFRTASGRVLSMDYLPRTQARAVYRLAQEMEERSLEIRRARSLEEMRAKAGGVNVQTNVAVPGITSGTSGQVDDPVVTLQKLKQMFDAGFISEQEFDTKRKEVLARM